MEFLFSIFDSEFELFEKFNHMIIDYCFTDVFLSGKLFFFSESTNFDRSYMFILNLNWYVTIYQLFLT